VLDYKFDLIVQEHCSNAIFRYKGATLYRFFLL